MYYTAQLATTIIIFVYLTLPTNGNICIWGESWKSGYYEQETELTNGKPSYMQSIYANCGTQSNGFKNTYTISWDSTGSSWMIESVGLAVYCDETELTDCTLGKWHYYSGTPVNIWAFEGTCPEWNCDQITTTYSLVPECQGPFQPNSTARNIFTNNDKSIWFYFMENTYQWVCRNDFNLRECASQGIAYPQKGWIDMSNTQSIHMNFSSYDYEASAYRNVEDVTISCSTVPTTAIPTVSPITGAPTQPTNNPITAAPTESTSNPTTAQPSTAQPTLAPSGLDIDTGSGVEIVSVLMTFVIVVYNLCLM
eukprot:456061_1